MFADTDTDFSNFFDFIFKEDCFLIEEEQNPLSNVFTVEEDLDDIDRDDIGILKDLHREVFINEECENRKVVVNGGKYTRHINKKARWFTNL